jgi:hypothetical protein
VTITFTHTPSNTRYPTITVTLNDDDHPFIEDALIAFEQFLLAMTFQQGSIDKFVNMTDVHKERMELERQAEALKEQIAKAKRSRK